MEISGILSEPRIDLTRRGFLVVSGGVVAAGLLRAPARAGAQAANPAVPTWESVYGFSLGQRQATAAEIDGYVQRLAAASPRVKAFTLTPPSVKGSALRYALVSHPDNLARFDEIARKTRALRLKPPRAAVAAQHAREEPALVHVVANVHGNEPSGSDALAKLLYELAAREDEANLARLRALVFVLMPVQNPDGRNASRRVNANGFDLNRDWFAFTQPESVGKLSLYSRYSPILGIDEHEQFLSAPDTFFFPPDNDPVHHESSRAGLEASDKVVTPAIEAAFTAKGYTWEHYGIYDVFYPGYGDVAPNQAFGAAGVLFEQENNEIYANKVARQFTATDAAVSAVAAHKRELLQAWADQWPHAKSDGRRGLLQPNVRHNPANPEPKPVPDAKVYGYALRTTRHAADVAHLVDRLRAFDVEVHVLRRPVRLKRLRTFGAKDFGPATLARGTIVIGAGQPMKRWIHILLADDPYPAVNYFYDVAGWSNPAMMALDGGAIGEPLTPLLRRPRRTRRQIARKAKPRAASLRAIDAAADLQVALPQAPAYSFALDAALAQAAAFRLLREGVKLTRLPAGAAVVDSGAREALTAAARRFGIRPRALATVPARTEAARRPKVALMHDLGADLTEVLFASSAGFALWLLRDRFGLDVTRVQPSDIDGGILASGGFDVLYVPDALATVIPGGLAPNVQMALPNGGLTPLGLQNIQAFVSNGGTYVGCRNQGVAVASAAGVAGDLATKEAPSGMVMPGGPVAIDLTGDDPAVRGLGARAYAFNVMDPILTGGGTTIARYPDTLLALCYQEQLEAVNGSVAATMVATGKGRAYVFGFDPAYRGFVEGVQRIVGNALLTPPSGTAGAAPRSVDPARARQLVAPQRHHLIRVAPEHAAALRAAVAATPGTPADLVLDGAQLQALDRDPLSGHPAAWMRQVLAHLQRNGVAPVLIVA